ncbi:MAG: MBL fold metallo-hydrolase [Planctomycetes bacterium]|nr:MBL fold metallo-hydrolase [Planctomycetota bacterium]
MKIGRWKLESIEAGSLRLDGGAMFGSVPKAIWSRAHPADEDNRIELSCRLLLADDGERRVLVDTGMGDKWDPKGASIYGLAEGHVGLRERLGAVGVDPDSISDVVLTHLHFDHAGGVSHRDQDGQLRPSFPRARHWLQHRNLENARHPNPRERASYLAENHEPLAAVELELLQGECEIMPGLRVMPSDGHTVGMQIVAFEDGERSLTYCADLIPTASHVHPAFTMGYDINAGLLIEEKARLMARRREGEHHLFFEHEPRGAAGRLVFADGRPRVDEFTEI